MCHFSAEFTDLNTDDLDFSILRKSAPSRADLEAIEAEELEVAPSVIEQYNAVAAEVADLIHAASWKDQVGYDSTCSLLYNNSIRRDFESIGLKCIGSGYFSAAFTHCDHPNKVFKFGFKKEDSGAAYAAFCRDKAGLLDNLPTIHHMTRRAKFYMVVLDELFSFYDFAESQGIARYSPAYEFMQEVHNEAQCLGRDLDFSHQEERLPRILGYSIPSVFERTLRSYIETWQNASETLTAITDYFEGIASFDLHDENFMFTQDGKLVITDPVSFSLY